MKIKKICWSILVGVVLLVLGNGSAFAYKYEDEELMLQDSDIKGGYYLFITNHMSIGGPGNGWYVGAKENIEDHLLTFAPVGYEYIYDETIKEWIVVNPPLKINLDNLKIYSADENIIKFTKENGAIYINYVSRGRTRVTAEYKFNGELYVVECAIQTWDWDWDLDEDETDFEDESQDENNQDTTSTTNPDENNNNSNQTEQTTTTIETPKQENEQKNNNNNVETKTETQTKSTTINTNTNKNENSIFSNTETQNDSNDFLLDSENKLVDAEYNNYTFNSEDQGLNVEDSFETNEEVKKQKLTTSEETKSSTSSSGNTGIIIIGMAVISVVIIAIIILIVKQSKNGAV